MTLLERLQGKAAGPPVFAPRVARFAARLEQVSLECLATDPGTLTRSLHATQRLLGLEAIVLDASDALFAVCHSLADPRFDWWRSLDPEALPRSPRWGAMLEAAARLRDGTGAGAGLMTLLPGPWTLAVELGDRTMPTEEALEAAGDACASVARAVAEARVTALIVVEGDVPQERVGGAEAGLRSICTMMRYYGVASVVCLPDAVRATGPLGSTGADVIVTPVGEQLPSGGCDMGYGLALPAAWFSASPPTNFALVCNTLAISDMRLVTTGGEVPETTPPEVIRQAYAVISGISR